MVQFEVRAFDIRSGMVPQDPARIGIEHVGVRIGSTSIDEANDARLFDNLFPHFFK